MLNSGHSLTYLWLTLSLLHDFVIHLDIISVAMPPNSCGSEVVCDNVAEGTLGFGYTKADL